jgi:hypothetical protein
MTSIRVKLTDLQKKIEELSEDGIENIKITIHEEAEDEDESFASFLYIEGYMENGHVRDYDSIDSIDLPKMSNVTFLQKYAKNG